MKGRLEPVALGSNDGKFELVRTVVCTDTSTAVQRPGKR